MTATTAQLGALSALVDWYSTLTPDSLDAIGRFYLPDAHFTDPFNSVCGYAAIRTVFEHMFDTVDTPRFAIQSQVMGHDEGFATWIFTGAVRGKSFAVPGSSHLRFAEDGRVSAHSDYWDAAALWRELPLIGAPVRWLQRRFMP
ncbi:SnoaL-like domain-containing protein [Cupriavidus sp. YR651]|uniref:nuclear transport factor 2 family protein n=1 Tax=Cupriavidus sp. YR651 TaxID=1855315 RepID=UPI00088AE2F4|nr:nuclear transport factor 2 family protein [Cupriavidus sp. YR651]SDD55476.1 SnoaL-like domain-containing protein [Cupriavidus sp. YR651]